MSTHNMLINIKIRKSFENILNSIMSAVMGFFVRDSRMSSK